MKNVLSVLVLLLGGCAGISRDVAPLSVYDFGQAERLAGQSGVAKTAGRLAVEVRAAPWLDTSAIDYRMDYDDALKRHQYASSRWVGTPATLLGQQLRQQLGVVSVNGGVATDCLLRVELQEFSHVFVSPKTSNGLLQAQVSLIDAKRRQIAALPVSIESPAATADAQGGVKALVLSGRELGMQLGAWLNRLDNANELKACTPGR